MRVSVARCIAMIAATSLSQAPENSMMRLRPMLVLGSCLLVFAAAAAAQPRAEQAREQNASAVDPALFKGMRWRGIGPFRGGRALAVEGISGEPGTFYFG